MMLENAKKKAAQLFTWAKEHELELVFVGYCAVMAGIVVVTNTALGKVAALPENTADKNVIMVGINAGLSEDGEGSSGLSVLTEGMTPEESGVITEVVEKSLREILAERRKERMEKYE